MLEVIISCKEEIQYPAVCRSLEDGIVVLFLSECRGVVIRTSPDSESKLGDVLNDWAPYSDNTIWEPVDITITG
ncbi:hypothetical protein BGI03_09280 [Snodgrassella alvi]|uniref:hypothetical protein n=1 Tax=Snodgrassella alvi TaxID=1196083 RepID=UPI0009FBA534|nr:hypothetical protein [Snodgrassella alvi]ORF05841.1 hypothetical protein BGH98_08005 [Snodgrassella alvi]ORF12162.1 hypothetical protein BGI01_07105 [Snodgrassella alvi]ORF16991.1 hypothetical protein BGI03_09280 [Snodgrassella alvi]ORF22501.1 hypothetical protein BGI04_00755 [Snodgrassella alvi]